MWRILGGAALKRDPARKPFSCSRSSTGDALEGAATSAFRARGAQACHAWGGTGNREKELHMSECREEGWEGILSVLRPWKPDTPG